MTFLPNIPSFRHRPLPGFGTADQFHYWPAKKAITYQILRTCSQDAINTYNVYRDLKIDEECGVKCLRTKHIIFVYLIRDFCHKHARRLQGI